MEVSGGNWMYLKYLQGSQQSYREKVMKAWEIEDQLFLTDWNWLDLGKVAAKGKLKKINSNKKRIDATRRQLQWERRSKGILVPSQTFFFPCFVASCHWQRKWLAERELFFLPSAESLKDKPWRNILNSVSLKVKNFLALEVWIEGWNDPMQRWVRYPFFMY